MAKRERIKKLAKRLRVDPSVALRTLHQMGETKYRSGADMIPAEVAERLDAALKLAGLATDPPPRAETPEPAPAAPATSVAAAPFTPEPMPDIDSGPGLEAAADPAPQEASPAKAEPAAGGDGGEAEPLSSSPFAGLKAAPAAEAPAADAADADAGGDDEDLQAEVARLRSELSEVRRDLDDAKKRAADAEDAWRAHAASRKQAVAAAEDLESRIDALQSDLKAAKRGRDKDRSEHEEQARSLKADVEAARTTPLRELFEQRGLEHPDEFGQALGFLLQEERSGPTVRSLRVQGPDKFAQKLKNRLMLWCGDAGCPTDHPEIGRIVVHPPARCEACKGKTIRRAAAAFVGACQSHNVLRVTIAGGSPNYRTAIQDAIGGGTELDVRVVLNGERNASQAQADVDHSELVVAWVSTEVDHKFTDLYKNLKSDRVLICPHRGISRMFEFATEHVNAGRAAAAQVAAPPV